MEKKTSNIYNVPIYHPVNKWWIQNACTKGMVAVESTTFLKIVLVGLEELKKAERKSASIKSIAEELPMILFHKFASKLKKNDTNDCYRCTLLTNCIIITCLNYSDSLILKEGIKPIAYWNQTQQNVLCIDANERIIKFLKCLRQSDKEWMRDYWNKDTGFILHNDKQTKLKSEWSNDEVLFANDYLANMTEEEQCDFFYVVSLCKNMDDFVRLVVQNWEHFEDARVKEKRFCIKAIAIVKFKNRKGGEWTVDAFGKNIKRNLEK